jgi:hypothetical protein
MSNTDFHNKNPNFYYQYGGADEDGKEDGTEDKIFGLNKSIFYAIIGVVICCCCISSCLLIFMFMQKGKGTTTPSSELLGMPNYSATGIVPEAGFGTDIPLIV